MYTQNHTNKHNNKHNNNNNNDNDDDDDDNTPGLHNKIPALKIFATGWVAQEPICSWIVA